MAFWQWFHDRKHITEHFEDRDLFRAELFAKLQDVSRDLYFELSLDSAPKELIVTTQGNRNVFAVADELVSLAPSVEGWCFLSLKPAMGFDFDLTMEGVMVRPSTMICRPVEIQEFPVLLGLVVGVEGFSNLPEETWNRMVLLALDAGLGEREHATSIDRIKVVDKNSMSIDDTIPLTQLPRFIAWLTNKHQGNGGSVQKTDKY